MGELSIPINLQIYIPNQSQTLYPATEEKVAHLLYFVVKNHSFSDGNKRIAAFLFIWFLERNNLLYTKYGLKRLPDDTLLALTYFNDCRKSPGR